MNIQQSTLKNILSIFFTTLFLTGCYLDGDDGTTGPAGINCWDLNGDRTNEPEEDINKDGQWDAQDCSSQAAVPVQNPDVELNHQHICEALANLGQYPTGCPSSTHTNPAGTLTPISFLLDSGFGYAVSCDYEPNNGLLSVVPKNGNYYWSLEGGFIAKTVTIEAVDELSNDACFNVCNADPECIASWASSELLPPVTAYTCHLFHHSDTVGNWERFCSDDIGNCARAGSGGQLSTAQRWSAICP